VVVVCLRLFAYCTVLLFLRWLAARSSLLAAAGRVCPLVVTATEPENDCGLPLCCHRGLLVVGGFDLSNCRVGGGGGGGNASVPPKRPPPRPSTKSHCQILRVTDHLPVKTGA